MQSNRDATARSKTVLSIDFIGAQLMDVFTLKITPNHGINIKYQLETIIDDAVFKHSTSGMDALIHF